MNNKISGQQRYSIYHEIIAFLFFDSTRLEPITFDYKNCKTQWKYKAEVAYNVISLSQTKSDNINQLIKLTSRFLFSDWTFEITGLITLTCYNINWLSLFFKSFLFDFEIFPVMCFWIQQDLNPQPHDFVSEDLWLLFFHLPY